MDAFISGAWRLVRRGEVTIGGAIRTLTRAEIYRSGAWSTAVRFTAPLSVNAFDVSGSRFNNNRPARITSTATQATPAGGLGPYTYAWTVISGSAAANSPNMAATTFGQTVSPGVTEDSIARVTCTDSLGSVATAEIMVILTNESNL